MGTESSGNQKSATVFVEIDGERREVTKQELFDLAKSGIVQPETRLFWGDKITTASTVRGIEFASPEAEVAQDPDALENAVISLLARPQIMPTMTPTKPKGIDDEAERLQFEQEREWRESPIKSEYIPPAPRPQAVQANAKSDRDAEDLLPFDTHFGQVVCPKCEETLEYPSRRSRNQTVSSLESKQGVFLAEHGIVCFPQHLSHRR